MLRKYTYPDYYPELQDLWNTRPHFIRSHLGIDFPIFHEANFVFIQHLQIIVSKLSGRILCALPT